MSAAYRHNIGVEGRGQGVRTVAVRVVEPSKPNDVRDIEAFTVSAGAVPERL